MKFTKENIEKNIPKNLPSEDVMLKNIMIIKQKHPKLYKKVIKTLKKKFPDKEFPE